MTGRIGAPMSDTSVTVAAIQMEPRIGEKERIGNARQRRIRCVGRILAVGRKSGIAGGREHSPIRAVETIHWAAECVVVRVAVGFLRTDVAVPGVR